MLGGAAQGRSPVGKLAFPAPAGSNKIDWGGKGWHLVSGKGKGVNMRTLVTAITIALGIVTQLPSSQNSVGEQLLQPPDRALERQQIAAILGRWEEAWNSHDMASFASLFHDDGVWVLWTGAVWTGRKAIEEGHAEVHKTIFRNSVQRERLEELTFVGPDAAVVRFCSVLIGDMRAPDKAIRSQKFLVVTKRDGVWKIGWGQNTRLADTVPDSECFSNLAK
jgi:uncharacterized protein (TIGR02246 family)